MATELVPILTRINKVQREIVVAADFNVDFLKCDILK